MTLHERFNASFPVAFSLLDAQRFESLDQLKSPPEETAQGEKASPEALTEKEQITREKLLEIHEQINVSSGW